MKVPMDYKWSSYNAYAYGKKDSVVEKHSIYKELSKDEIERRKRNREFIRGMLKNRNANERGDGKKSRLW